MKMRFFPVLGIILSLALTATSWAAESTNKTIIIDPATVEFTTPANLPECAKLAGLSGDPAKGAFTALVKLMSGCSIPWHWHTYSENLMIVSGKGQVEMKDGSPFQFQPGAYLSMPGHHIHQAKCDTDCVLFLSSDGAFDIHYVNKKGQEIPAAKVLKKATPEASK
jgi:quercetin dioxygenase-like cupin family protein